MCPVCHMTQSVCFSLIHHCLSSWFSYDWLIHHSCVVLTLSSSWYITRSVYFICFSDHLQADISLGMSNSFAFLPAHWYIISAYLLSCDLQADISLGMSISFADLVTCTLIYHSVFQAIALFNAGQCKEAMLLFNKLTAVCLNTDALVHSVIEVCTMCLCSVIISTYPLFPWPAGWYITRYVYFVCFSSCTLIYH
jgi:hypothetical protein